MPEITNADVIKTWGNASYEAAVNHGDEGDFARQYLLNPALFALLGEVKGKRILDAGCGQGYLCRLLARKGAIVTGVEPAEAWYRYAQEQEQAHQLGITYFQEDLSRLQNLDNTFDYVVANMVLMDIPDYEAAIHNCIASLKPTGGFIFSITHPCFEESASEWVQKGYVAVREYFQEFALPSTYGYQFHRSLSSYLNLVIQEGCILKKIVEPRLDPSLAQQNKLHERNIHVPQYLLVHTIKQ